MSDDILESFGEFEGDSVLNENRHHLEPEELLRLFSVLKERSPHYWHPFFYVMYQFGCRVSEVRIIKKEAISPSRREIVIYRLKKRQWDKSKRLDLNAYKSAVLKSWPNAELDNSTKTYTFDGLEVGTFIVDKNDNNVSRIKNKSKGIKRYLYKIDDSLMEAIEMIQLYNSSKGLTEESFLFPALRKRKSTTSSSRMVKIGRLDGHHSISRTACWRAFKEACVAASIPEKLSKDHVLRHTRATLMLADGAPEEQVQYLLGHENIATTRGYMGLANALRAKYQTELPSEFAKNLLG